MWDLINRTPFSTFSGFDRDKDGKAYWIVWAKATFRMRHERPCLFEREQVELFREPLYRGSPENTDLLAENDICFPKPKPDVIITGYGYRPVDVTREDPFDVTATIGDWKKSLTILPAMRWSDRLRPEQADTAGDAVFLGFRNAYGGIDTETDTARYQEHVENPIGQGFWASSNAARGKPLPRVVSQGTALEKWDSPLKAVSFTCVPKERPRRTRHSGTYDEAWMRRKSPLLPDDFDERYWQFVDQDQSLEAEPSSGARITLTNMMPRGVDSDGGAYTVELPRLTFELLTRFKGKWQETDMALQTIHLLPEQGLLTLSYCGSMPIRAVANDVLVERSELILREHSGFRVRPQDADSFDPSGAEVSV
ncbi:DUF2169 domain-containing protein [Mesorhizobium sp. YR577]|uniref:DUF2169 family type VI secretion system accessory protein n=1 Tax=Mesorhizobium sp. YR577 TaxID=1884373 RepID=UPI0008E027CD|nr:DUF2169 domain-containing protein [Mesorhizobium sp. YR577]SFU10981.1 hypothetical protein SAMN05518861_11356 [Mesorhizobium sp. YR577]